MVKGCTDCCANFGASLGTFFFGYTKEQQQKANSKEDAPNVTSAKIGKNDFRLIDGRSKVQTTLFVIAAISALATILGALVFFNVIGVGAGLGTNALTNLSQNAAFWMMVGGGIATFTSLLLAIVQAGVHRSRIAEPKKPKDEVSS